MKLIRKIMPAILSPFVGLTLFAVTNCSVSNASRKLLVESKIQTSSDNSNDVSIDMVNYVTHYISDTDSTWCGEGVTDEFSNLFYHLNGNTHNWNSPTFTQPSLSSDECLFNITHGKNANTQSAVFVRFAITATIPSNQKLTINMSTSAYMDNDTNFFGVRNDVNFEYYNFGEDEFARPTTYLVGCLADYDYDREGRSFTRLEEHKNYIANHGGVTKDFRYDTGSFIQSEKKTFNDSASFTFQSNDDLEHTWYIGFLFGEESETPSINGDNGLDLKLTLTPKLAAK